MWTFIFHVVVLYFSSSTCGSCMEIYNDAWNSIEKLHVNLLDMFYEWLCKAYDLKVATSIWNFLYYKISQSLIILLFFLGRSQISLIKAMGIGIIFIVKVTYWWLVFSNTVHSWYMYRLIRTHLAANVVFRNNCCIL